MNKCMVKKLLKSNDGFIKTLSSDKGTPILRYRVSKGKLYFEIESQNETADLFKSSSVVCDKEWTAEFLNRYSEELDHSDICYEMATREDAKMAEVVVSAEKWAKTLGISEDEYNKLLMELGYLANNNSETKTPNSRWEVTDKGWKHIKLSKNLFKRTLLWDVDTHFQVHKLLGKKRRTYIFCDKCDAYLNKQTGFDTEVEKIICEKCGHINILAYKSDEEQVQESMDISSQCSVCGRMAWGIDEIIVLFGFQRTEKGLRPHTTCKRCREQT